MASEAAAAAAQRLWRLLHLRRGSPTPERVRVQGGGPSDPSLTLVASGHGSPSQAPEACAVG